MRPPPLTVRCCRTPRRQVLNNFPEVKRSIEEAKKRREAETEAAKDLVQTFKTKEGASEKTHQLFQRGRNKAAAIGALGSKDDNNKGKDGGANDGGAHDP